MYKLKNTYVNMMIKNKLTSRETDFILHIAKYQSEAGCVESVYYKEVCEKIGISVQKFYDVLQNLSNKGMITYEKKNPSDVSVTLIGNDFRSVDFSSEKVPGYINVAQNRFYSKSFREMKAGAKLLYLYSQRFMNGKHMLVENFYDDFCRLFSVTKKTLQEYIHELKIRKLLFISLKRNRAYHYEMTMQRSTVLHEKGIIPQEKELYEENIANLIKRTFKKAIPAPDANGRIRAVEDVVGLTRQQRAKKKENFIHILFTAIRESLHQQKAEKKARPVINAALVNKWISAAEEIIVQREYGIILP